MKMRAVAIGVACALAASPAASQQVIGIASNPQGSQFFTVAAAVAKLLDQRGIQARVQPMGGPTTYVPLLSRGEVEFAMLNADDADTGYHGTEAYEGKPNAGLRLVAAVFPLPVSIAVVADSPAKTLRDLKGLRLTAGFASQTTLRKVQDALLANAGLSMADVRPVPVINPFQGTDALAGGRVDAATTAPTINQSREADATLSGRGGIRFLPIDTSPAPLAAMQKIIPSRPLTLRIEQNLPGIKVPTPVMAYSTFLVASEKTSDELVQRVAKALHDESAMLQESTPVLKGFNPNAMAEAMPVPYHPGAEKYYREIGQWPPR
jgi:TRAP transporter TAXI family solute receptor